MLGHFRFSRAVLKFASISPKFATFGVHNFSKMPSALVILSEGAEEMEAIISADVLRRGGVRKP